MLVTETHTIHNYLIRILSFGFTMFTIYVHISYGLTQTLAQTPYALVTQCVRVCVGVGVIFERST